MARPDAQQVIAELENCIENASRWNVSARVPSPESMIIYLDDGTRFELTVRPLMPGKPIKYRPAS